MNTGPVCLNRWKCSGALAEEIGLSWDSLPGNRTVWFTLGSPMAVDNQTVLGEGIQAGWIMRPRYRQRAMGLPELSWLLPIGSHLRVILCYQSSDNGTEPVADQPHHLREGW